MSDTVIQSLAESNIKSPGNNMPRRKKKYGEAVETTTHTSSVKTELSDATQSSYSATSAKGIEIVIFDIKI